MRLLHVSDLHLTEPFQSLSEVWAGVDAVIRGQVFDAIVVTGDLSQRADESEYRALEAFAHSTLENHVPNRERWRVVFIPGNHDVRWGAPIFSHLPTYEVLEKGGANHFRKLVREARYGGGESHTRVRISPDGSACLYQTNEKTYHLRFSEISNFFRTYYSAKDDRHAADRTAPAIRHDGGSASLDVSSARDGVVHEFNLSTPGEDWSCHIFSKHRVAIFGFNSCFRNDELWTGARIDPNSVAAAASLAHRICRDYLLIAVWHHGLGGEGYREDYLRPTDIGVLYNAGFRIGLHGHTHRASQRSLEDIFDDRFLLVSTGSLGAGAAERPDAVGNQFSIVEAYASYARIERYERDGLSGVYRQAGTWTHSIQSLLRHRRTEISATRHYRQYHISSDGLASVEVSISGLSGRGTLVLGLLSPPFCGARGSARAQTNVGYVEVDKHILADGRIRFSVLLPDESIDTIKWSCVVSNAHLISARELAFVKISPLWSPVLDGAIGRPHTVRFATSELVLEWIFDFDVTFQDALVERRARDGERKYWESVSSESARCRVETIEKEALDAVMAVPTPIPENRQIQRRGVRLTIDGPAVGSRVSLPYLPAAAPRDFTIAELGFSKLILTSTRRRIDEAGWVANLVQMLERCVVQVLGLAPAGMPNWQATFWEEDEARLLPAFGRFPRSAWGIRFPCGSGVTGHCFRRCRVTAWHRKNDADELMYQRKPEGHDGDGHHQWLICVPLLLEPDGPAIGVVTLEGFESDGGVALDQIARSGPPSDPLLLRLQSMLNVVFWEGMKDVADLAAYATLAGNVARLHAPETSEEGKSSSS